jgi:hypothetical protein
MDWGPEMTSMRSTEKLSVLPLAVRALFGTPMKPSRLISPALTPRMLRPCAPSRSPGAKRPALALFEEAVTVPA